MSFLRKCTIVLILIGCSACNPYGSKRIPVGNAAYIAGAAAKNKNVTTVQPVSLCGPDFPCLGSDDPFMMHDSLSDVTMQKNEEAALPVKVEPAVKSVQVIKTSKDKKKASQAVARKGKNSTSSPIKGKVSDKKGLGGAVLSEDLTSAPKTPPSVPEDFISLSQVPDKVYTDERLKEMYEDKEAKQTDIHNKSAQLSAPDVPSDNKMDMIPENPMQVQKSARSAEGSSVPMVSVPSVQETDNILKQIIEDADEMQEPSPKKGQKEKEPSQTEESSADDIDGVNYGGIKIPPEAVTNITE